jgi:hypothetical protein
LGEVLLGFPLSLAFALIPIYIYRPGFNRRLWLLGTLVVTCLFLLLPEPIRIEAFMPGGAAVFFLASGIWVVALNPTSSVFKLLNMPLPTRKELKAEIEKVADVEGRVQKYLALTIQLKKIWQKRDAFLSGYNSALLMVFTIVSTVVSFGMAAHNYFMEKHILFILDEMQKHVGQRLAAANMPALDVKAWVIDMSPTLFFVSSFIGVLCLGVFLRIFARIRFKQNVVQGHMSLFKLPDSWIWGLIVTGGAYVLGLRLEAPPWLMFAARNGLMILLFLYMLQGIGIVALYFEVRLLPVHWIALGIMLTGIWVPELIQVFALLFTILGVTEVWLGLRKRSLRPVQDSDLS